MKNLFSGWGNAEGPKEKLKHFVFLSISQDFAGVQFGLPWGTLHPPACLPLVVASEACN